VPLVLTKALAFGVTVKKPLLVVSVDMSAA
jgi:hypothetical protein